VPVNREFDDLLLVECIRTTPHFYLGVERWTIFAAMLCRSLAYSVFHKN
jgi:hypothetical protein